METNANTNTNGNTDGNANASLRPWQRAGEASGRGKKWPSESYKHRGSKRGAQRGLPDIITEQSRVDRVRVWSCSPRSGAEQGSQEAQTNKQCHCHHQHTPTHTTQPYPYSLLIKSNQIQLPFRHHVLLPDTRITRPSFATLSHASRAFAAQRCRLPISISPNSQKDVLLLLQARSAT